MGTGTYGAVFKALHKITKDARAIKAIAKSKVVNKESFQNEIQIMKKLVSREYFFNTMPNEIFFKK